VKKADESKKAVEVATVAAAAKPVVVKDKKAS